MNNKWPKTTELVELQLYRTELDLGSDTVVKRNIHSGGGCAVEWLYALKPTLNSKERRGGRDGGVEGGRKEEGEEETALHYNKHYRTVNWINKIEIKRYWALLKDQFENLMEKSWLGAFSVHMT